MTMIESGLWDELVRGIRLVRSSVMHLRGVEQRLYLAAKDGSQDHVERLHELTGALESLEMDVNRGLWRVLEREVLGKEQGNVRL